MEKNCSTFMDTDIYLKKEGKFIAFGIMKEKKERRS